MDHADKRGLNGTSYLFEFEATSEREPSSVYKPADAARPAANDGRYFLRLLPAPVGHTWNDTLESLHDDHLGSTHVVTDETGAVLRTIAYDPWGQARSAENWTEPIDAAALEDLGPGFTGHPARLDADLLDMGGRSYHPLLARFFSPDPLVVSPLDAQAYNRYSYVHNRPLVATDPTGYGTDLGDDDGGGGSNNASSDCGDLEHDCYRLIVVSDPDHASSSPSIDAWTTSLATFDAYNGLGQGGPGGGHPYSPNGIRHGTDAGQPGGTPVFTTEVTPDMCAEIAACSGRLSKQAPIYIWDAPIDAWARTAVDVATDFVPGVAQAKTAYDAYERIQNGEDPVDVLMAAGGEAALGLIPGLKAGNKARKALDKADDVADAAGDVQTLANRAGEVHGVLHPVAQAQRTTAVLDSTAGRIVAGGGRDLTPAQRAALLPGEVPGKLPGAHAEMTALETARQHGGMPQALGVTRSICPACQAAIEKSGGHSYEPHHGDLATIGVNK